MRFKTQRVLAWIVFCIAPLYDIADYCGWSDKLSDRVAIENAWQRFTFSQGGQYYPLRGRSRICGVAGFCTARRCLRGCS